MRHPALGSEWLPADWKVEVDGESVTVIRGLTGERMTVEQAISLRDLLTTTSKMVVEARPGRRAA